MHQVVIQMQFNTSAFAALLQCAQLHQHPRSSYSTQDIACPCTILYPVSSSAAVSSSPHNSSTQPENCSNTFIAQHRRPRTSSTAAAPTAAVSLLTLNTLMNTARQQGTKKSSQQASRLVQASIHQVLSQADTTSRAVAPAALQGMLGQESASRTLQCTDMLTDLSERFSNAARCASCACSQPPAPALRRATHHTASCLGCCCCCWRSCRRRCQ